MYIITQYYLSFTYKSHAPAHVLEDDIEDAEEGRGQADADPSCEI